MTNKPQNEAKHQDDARHMEVIPRRHRELFNNKQNNAQRYTNDWIYGWPANTDRSVFMKTEADRINFKRIKHGR